MNWLYKSVSAKYSKNLYWVLNEMHTGCCSQPEHGPTLSHQMSQGRKKNVARPGLELRVSRLPCEHSTTELPSHSIDRLHIIIKILLIFRTALMAAAKKGHCETCEFLLKKGADPTFTDVQGLKKLFCRPSSIASGKHVRVMNTPLNPTFI